VQSAEFDRLLVATVQRAFPPHEHEQLVAHYHGLVGAWANDQCTTAGQACLVPHQATFALLTILPRRRSWAWRFRQAI
jgi:hypothetical protein